MLPLGSRYFRARTVARRLSGKRPWFRRRRSNPRGVASVPASTAPGARWKSSAPQRDRRGGCIHRQNHGFFHGFSMVFWKFVEIWASTSLDLQHPLQAWTRREPTHDPLWSAPQGGVVVRGTTHRNDGWRRGTLSRAQIRCSWVESRRILVTHTEMEN